MKKSNYVTKYDYLAYYTKQPAMWFFSNAELEAAYKLQYELAHDRHHLNDLDEEDDEENEEAEVDSYELYRVLKNEEEMPYYTGNETKFQQYLDELRHVDDVNPLIVEGRIIDQESKAYIIRHYTKEDNTLDVDYNIFDFDEIYQGVKLEQQAVYTAEKLANYENVIIFQPVFIDKKREIATKCDALVKCGKNINIIETKATSSVKIHHFLDLLFQHKILETIFNPKDYFLHYELCLIKYERLLRKQVSFILTDRVNLSKSVSITKENHYDLQQKQAKKLAQPFDKLNKKEELVTDLGGPLFDELFELEFDEEIFNSAIKNRKKVLIENTINEFNDVILNLWEHKSKMTMNDIPGNFTPSRQDKSDFKNTDMWLVLRKLYLAKGYLFFNYSGNVLDMSAGNLQRMTDENLLDTNEIEDFLNGKAKDTDRYKKNHERFVNPKVPNFTVDEKETVEILKTLKPKKVYFDFESINPSIRAIDKSLPFTQAITQNSVIKDHGHGVLNEKCINMVRDPNFIDIPWFKAVIDELYEGEDYSYVVYNKNFETLRLTEMAEFINEEEYWDKVKCINKNIFDLADFFSISTKKEAVFIKELGGFYSIKKVLPLVEKYQPKIFEETGCKDYKTLAIGNGLVCQQKTMARFYGTLSDEDWNTLVRNVSIYCENDVRAMVAVEYLVTKFILPTYAPDCLAYVNTLN
ncbi:DUF2779 domain-containing protein [Ureaplasma ceti]|uniref:DUF2779 domain-containing protein n=1 Tax=Ureaplasma ceti TaxID=3119530 RepID=A0ABP9U6A4_9BACT